VTVGTGATSVNDTVLTPIPLKFTLLSAINTGAGANVMRDTLVFWETPTGVAQYYTNGLSKTYDLSPYPFRDYLIGLGKNDSGVFRFVWREWE
jgi:hypothetical protein